MNSITSLLFNSSLKAEENTLVNGNNKMPVVSQVSTQPELSQEMSLQTSNEENAPVKETVTKETEVDDMCKECDKSPSSLELTQEQQVIASLMSTENSLNDGESDGVAGNIDVENIKDIELGSVSKLSEMLSGYSYAEIRASLHYKYGLTVKDEPSFEKLYMITYQKRERLPQAQDGAESQPLTPDQQKIVDQYRGIIVEKDTNRPLCYTFDRMSRHLPDDWDVKECEVTETCDGSQIKIFFYEEGNFWVVSTTRRIDASRTYFFSEKSFLDMFQDSATHLDWNRLNKDCCYSFVLSHPENRVVTRHERPGLTHVLTRNMKTFEIVKDDDIGIDRPHKLVFQQKRDIWNAVKRLPYYKEGYVVRKGDQYVKIINKKYQEVKNLRGSSSSLLTHFFHLRKTNKINQFLKYYPEFRETFAAFEDSFYNLCCHAYNEYVLLRVRKVIEITQVLPFLKPVLYRIHGIHIQRHIRITLGDVQRHLEQYSPYNLRRLVDMANGLPFAFL